VVKLSIVITSPIAAMMGDWGRECRGVVERGLRRTLVVGLRNLGQCGAENADVRALFANIFLHQTTASIASLRASSEVCYPKCVVLLF